MTYSYSVTDTTTFTYVHARHIAAKVATDLKRMQRFYGKPSDQSIQEFETEVIEFLRGGYLDTVKYGFKRNGHWIEPTLSYKARDLSGDTTDNDPGRIRPRANIEGASFYSYLIKNSAWQKLTREQQIEFNNRLPFPRTAAPEPGISGYWSKDKTYSAGGRAVDRSSLRS